MLPSFRGINKEKLSKFMPHFFAKASRQLVAKARLDEHVAMDRLHQHGRICQPHIIVRGAGAFLLPKHTGTTPNMEPSSISNTPPCSQRIEKSPSLKL